MFLSGAVVVDDGTPLTEPAAIQTICKGVKRVETHTDSHGGFSFEFANRLTPTSGEVVTDSDIAWPSSPSGRGNQRDWRDCEIQAVLPGFVSETIQLSTRFSGFESSDVGRLVLHRMGQVEGFTISATSAMAPDKARKAFEKGREDEKNSKWDAAQKNLERAVQLYPRYAAAWLELGRVQAQKNEAAAARESFNQALQADPKFVSPYEELARLAAHDQQWQEVADVTNKLVALNPLLPRAWFLNAIADYYLQKWEAAEKSVRQGIKIDDEHRIPKMEYLLAMILLQKHDYPQAGEHMRDYLRLAPKAEDADLARKQLAEIEKLSPAASNSPQAGENK